MRPCIRLIVNRPHIEYVLAERKRRGIQLGSERFWIDEPKKESFQ